MRNAWVMVLALVGCVESNSITCEGGFVCPAGLACDEAHHGCVAQAQIDACAGMPDETLCTITSANDGLCTDGVCLVQKCGDGVITGSEQCDGTTFSEAKYTSCRDGFGFYDDGVVTCTQQCKYNLDACARSCGDDNKDNEEVCDGSQLGQYSDCRELGYYDPGALACTGACTYDTSACQRRCGDQIKDPEEVCDGAPPAQGCIDFGYDAGFAPCAPICAPALQDCQLFGWKTMGLPTTHNVASMVVLGDTLYAGMTAGEFMTYQAGGTPTVTTTAGDPADFTSLWVSSPTDIWAAPKSFGLYHLSGTTWTEDFRNVGATHAFWGFAPNDVYLFYDAGTWHWNGSAWSADSSVPSLGSPTAAYASATNNLFVLAGATLHHFNGTWGTKSIAGVSTHTAAGGIGSTIFIGGTNSAGDAVVARSQDGGVGWTVTNLTTIMAANGFAGNVISIHVKAVDDVWALVGSGVYHFDGKAWSVDVLPTTLPLLAVVSLGSEVLAGGYDALTGQGGRTYRFLGTSLVDLSEMGSPSRYELVLPRPATSGSARASDDMWIGTAGDGGLTSTTAHFDGQRWTTYSMPAGVTKAVGAFAQFATNDVYAAVVDAGIYHFNGASWSNDLGSTQASGGIWGTDASHLHALVYNQIRTRGASWTVEYAGTRQMFGIYGRADNDIWAVGNQITMHYNGANWSIVGEGNSMWGGNAVWTAPGADVFVADRAGVIHRFDGTTWTHTSTGTAFDLTSIWGTSNNDVFAVGNGSTVLHFDGTNWAPVRVDVGTQLLSVFGAGGTVIFGGGTGVQGVVRQLNRTRPW